ncbi:MAG: hypothetical protein H8E13_11500 [Actinobacteria bacterium]|nr:hypothetical protein [Actinomycetota bacterium]
MQPATEITPGVSISIVYPAASPSNGQVSGVISIGASLNSNQLKLTSFPPYVSKDGINILAT